MTSGHDWIGPVGDVWAREWRRTDRSFAGLAPHLDAAIRAAADGAHHVVDIGCGAGATAIATADALPHAHVTGIDLSPALLAIARARSAPRAIRFVAGDAIAESAGLAPIDLFVSRHGVMFFADPVAVFAALGAAAAPGARLVFSCFAARAANAWAAETLAAVGIDGQPPGTAPGPFAFGDPAYIAEILAASGWHAQPPHRVDFAYRAGEGEDPVSDAIDYFTRIGPAAAALRDMPSAERTRALARLTAVCERRRSGDAVDFPAVAWIWSAIRPGGTS